MRIYEVSDYNEMSRKAANIISAQVILKPNCVLGLATGSTPEGIYKQLIEWYQKGDIDFTEVKSINLDEYKGLAPENDQSYRYYMNDKFFNHINICSENTHVPNGLAPEETECSRYDALIQSLGGVDLQLLGLGANGHIGFNEPGVDFAKGTHCVKLSEETVKANSRFFETIDAVPKYAYSMGIQTIMQAKKILLIASGTNKADALYQAVCGPINPNVPASILQLHTDVTIIADKEALSKIDLAKAK